MADYNSSLPIRTENPGDAIVKLADATTPANQLKIEADGSINVNADVTFAGDSVDVTDSEVLIKDAAGHALDVNPDGSLNVVVASLSLSEIKLTDGTDDLEINADGSINSVVTATDLDVRDLTHVSDSVKLGDGVDFLSINPDGSVDANIKSISDGMDFLSINPDGSIDTNIKSISDGMDFLSINPDGSIDANIKSISDGMDFLAINVDGSLNTNILSISDGTDLLNINTDGSLSTQVKDSLGNVLAITPLGEVNANIKSISDGVDLLAINVDGSLNTNILSISDGVDLLNINSDGSLSTQVKDGLGNALAITPLGQINAIVSATDLDVRDLDYSTDNVEIKGSTGNSLGVDGSGFTFAHVDDNGGSLTVDATAFDIRLLTSSDVVTAVATDLDIRDLSHSSDSVKIGDGTDFLAVNADGSLNVKVLDSSPGADVNDYNTSPAVAGAATSNHDYTSTGDFYLTQIEASGSGKMKIEVFVNSVSKFVQFNSTSSPNMSITLKQPILATTGQVVRIARTNREVQAQDVYSTISGYTL